MVALWQFSLFTDGPAQTGLAGRVLDAQGNPVANIEVLLHAVTESAGSDIDRDSTNADGRFALDAGAGIPNAVYFVAVVYNGELYMGDLMRAPFPVDQEYIVQVGVNPVKVPAAEALPPAAQQPPANRTAGIVVIVAATAILATVVRAAYRRQPAAERRWLVELARLEDDLANGEDARSALVRRRNQLRERLKAPRSG